MNKELENYLEEQIESLGVLTITDEVSVETLKNICEKYCELKLLSKPEAPKCPKCGADETKQSCIGKWEDGKEYRCDDCGNEWEFNHLKWLFEKAKLSTGLKEAIKNKLNVAD
jgi:predicted RNA-binding Zn-ribbon protein involved in translation (DUF1610 family)